MGTRQKEVLVAELERSASHGWMKNLKIHTKSALFGAGLVVLVGVLSAQTFNHQFFAVRVLETPQMTIDQISTPVQISMVKTNRQATTVEIGLSANADYIVPFGKFLVVKKVGVQGALMAPTDPSQSYNFSTQVGVVPPLYPDSMGEVIYQQGFGWTKFDQLTPRDAPFLSLGGSEFNGEAFIAYPGDRVFHRVVSIVNGTVTNYKWIIQGYLVDSDS